MTNREAIKILKIERDHMTPTLFAERIEAIDMAISTLQEPERKTGKWIDKEVVDDRKDAKIQQWQQARCSVCNKWHTTPYMYYFNDYDFCPNCGADMRGKLNER